jgi:hypothetical protein
MTRYLASAAALVACLVIAGLVFIQIDTAAAPSPRDSASSASSTVEIGGRVIRVSVADTAAARQTGLGGRNSLAPDEGMLFIFPEDGTYGFWMKDLRFAIDILWLASDRTVISMAQNVSPETYPRVFTPEVPARYVLELHAGFAKAYAVDIGDEVRF